jgi:hypothetical protein
MRASSSAARAISSTDASMRRSAKRLCRAISARSGSLSRCPSSTVGTMRGSSSTNAWREHRVGEREDEQQLERLRLRGGALDNAPHELAALSRQQRHGDEAARRNAHLREAQQRLAVDAALQDRRDARAPRRAAPAEHVHQRRRQVERARRALALPTAGACTESPSHSRCSASASHATRRASTRFATKRSAAAISTPRSSPSPLLKPSTQCLRRNAVNCSRAGARSAVGQRREARASPANSSTATTCAPRSSCSGAMRLARASRCAPQRVQPNERAAAYANRANSASKRPPDCDCKPPRPANISMPACMRAAKPVMSLIESPPPLPPAPARFVVGCHAIDGRKLAQLGQILLVGEARLELAQTSRQLRRGDKRNGAARGAHATRQRISIQRAPNSWRAVKVERRLVAVVARVGRHARTSSSQARRRSSNLA